jgi:endonuclease/exonuclease/phosphatase family metal-dependent hydrolase
MKNVFKIVKWGLGLGLLFLLYLVGCIVYGTATDFQPPEKTILDIEKTAKVSPSDTIKKAKLSFLNWNIGYGGLGGKSDFFYDGGHFFFSGDKMVRSPQAFVQEYVAGITDFIQNTPTDFVLLQEVDRGSKRSYYTNEYQEIGKKLSDHHRTFAANFVVQRVPIPICEPWNVMGEMNSGLASYSTYEPKASTRFQFPGEYGWPNRIFHLDRCMSVQHFPTSHPEGKELVVINTHNSAYDGGKLKQQEMEYFKKYVLAEYAKGNYVIVGGDWNQSPPSVPFDQVANAHGIPTDAKYNSGNIAADFLPEGWQWVYDINTPTNRKVTEKLVYGETFMVLIDYYLVSPNIRPLKIKGHNLKFAYTDHNPVYMEVELLGLPIPVGDSVVVDHNAIN